MTKVIGYKTESNSSLSTFHRGTGECLFPNTPMVLSAPCDVHRNYKVKARESCEVMTAAPFTSKLTISLQLEIIIGFV